MSHNVNDLFSMETIKVIIFFFHSWRFADLTHLAVIGGELDMRSPQEVSKKFADELAVTLLNSRGRVSVSFCA